MAGDPVSWFEIEPGWRVDDPGGGELGSVEEVLGDAREDIFDGLSVVGGLGGLSHYVAAEHVSSITSDGRITLDIDHDTFERLPEPGRR
ncbi:MAG TPA: hypothetical protein VLV46_09190 [Gaiellaceae bacterium]|nr:hypothetical protein [Gaiellaceae bacterium]